MIDQTSQKILCVATSVGKTHDFALYKNSRLALAPTIELLAGTGYQGVDKLHHIADRELNDTRCRANRSMSEGDMRVLPRSRFGFAGKMARIMCIVQLSTRYSTRKLPLNELGA